MATCYFNAERVRKEIRRVMRERNLSQQAAAMDAGVSSAFISDVLLGRREPSGKLLDWLGLERVVLYRSKRWGNKRPTENSLSDGPEA